MVIESQTQIKRKKLILYKKFNMGQNVYEPSLQIVAFLIIFILVQIQTIICDQTHSEPSQAF